MRLMLFDWNGTLLDDMAECYRATCAVFHAFDKKPITQNEIYSNHEPKMLVAWRAAGITAPEKEIRKIWNAEYAKTLDNLKLTPDAQETLTALQEQEMILGLISGEHIERAIPVIKRLGVFHFFHYMQFGVIDKAVHIEQFCADSGITKDQCCYVGNVPSDICYAQKAGVTSVAFLTHHYDPAIILATKPDHAIINMEQMLFL